jgi:uncharacterized protein YjdB
MVKIMKKVFHYMIALTACAAVFASCEKEEKIVGTADGNGLFLNKAEITIVKGNQEALVATVTPKGAAKVSWVSSDAAVASVTAEGVVTAVGAGEATVTASASGKSVECLVKVSSPVTSVVPSVSELTIEKGATGDLSVTIGPDDINVPYSIKWTSSDETIATVAADAGDPTKAVVTGRMGGYATIYVKAGDVTSSIDLTVNVDMTGLVISGVPSGKVYKGDSFQLSVRKDPADALGVLDPVWSSSDETIATVDEKTGLVNLVGAGDVTFTVASNGFTQSVDVTVNVLATVSFLPKSANTTIEDVTFTGTNCSFYGSYSYIRKGATMTFSVPDGLVISEIVFTPYSSYYSTAFTPDSGEYSGNTWTGNAQTVVFTNNNSNTYLTNIKVTYKN